MNPLYAPYADDAGVGARPVNALQPPPYLPARVTGQDWVDAGRTARNAGQAAFVDPLWDMTQGLRSILHGDFSSPEATSGIMAGIGAMAPPGLARALRGAAPAMRATNALATESAPSPLARILAQSYAHEPFWRGDQTGAVPKEFPAGAFFSRDEGYSAALAKTGGRDKPEEYRLNLRNAFNFNKPVNAEHYARLIGAMRESDPQLAHDMVDMIAPGRSVDWFMGYAKAFPHEIAADNGGLIHQMIGRGTRESVDTVFRRAGFDAIDTGRDVQKLGGYGIRDPNAKFDPAHADSQNIMAGLAGLLGVPLTARMVRDDPNSQ